MPATTQSIINATQLAGLLHDGNVDLVATNTISVLSKINGGGPNDLSLAVAPGGAIQVDASIGDSAQVVHGVNFITDHLKFGTGGAVYATSASVVPATAVSTINIGTGSDELFNGDALGKFHVDSLTFNQNVALGRLTIDGPTNLDAGTKTISVNDDVDGVGKLTLKANTVIVTGQLSTATAAIIADQYTLKRRCHLDQPDAGSVECRNQR